MMRSLPAFCFPQPLDTGFRRYYVGAGIKFAARSDPMIFPDDHPAPPVDGGTPVLGGPDRLEPLVDELPGAGAIRPHFAAVLPRAAARDVEHVLCALGDGADALEASLPASSCHRLASPLPMKQYIAIRCIMIYYAS
jgi:hypothetical protein